MILNEWNVLLFFPSPRPICIQIRKEKDLSFLYVETCKTLDNGPFLLKQLISIPVFFYLANNVEECFAFNNTLPIIVAHWAKFWKISAYIVAIWFDQFMP